MAKNLNACPNSTHRLARPYNGLTLFHDKYLPGMWIWRALVGCSG
ncbi:hypothetical protein VN97_g13109, partial [Penicillium thymicola]